MAESCSPELSLETPVFAQLDALVASGTHALAVAVSGGSDSMALLRLSARWAKLRNITLHALTVDHGLRPEGAQEAAQVAGWCSHIGVSHAVLRWQPQGTMTGSLQAQARDGRYLAMADWCRAQGVSQLLLAHHRGDQAETLFFRLARGSQLRGLACMQAQSEQHGLRLLRPLLEVPKARLVTYLKAIGQPWCEDPSNQRTDYTRNHIRALLAAQPQPDALEARAAALAAFFARLRAALEAREQAARAGCIAHETVGEATLRHSAYAALPPEIALLLVGELICRLTRAPHPPRTQPLEQLCAWLKKPDAPRRQLAQLEFQHAPAADAIHILRARMP